MILLYSNKRRQTVVEQPSRIAVITEDGLDLDAAIRINMGNNLTGVGTLDCGDSGRDA